MKAKVVLLIILIISLFGLLTVVGDEPSEQISPPAPKKSHWFILHRKSGEEFLYYGISGDTNNSKILRKFQVKTGVLSSSPTPLPKFLGRDYWRIVEKESSENNPDTAPYFLRLDIPSGPDWPFGPTPYDECLDQFGQKIQCDWQIPGYFGLHGVGGNDLKLSKEDAGSTGCVRHTDADITYLYNLLDPKKEEIRYYIKDI